MRIAYDDGDMSSLRAAFIASLLIASGCDSSGSGPSTVGDTCMFDADCDDGLYCNGEERCGVGGRCQAAGFTPCFDGQECDESLGECVTRCEVTRDADGDGHIAIACGGRDCDDQDPDRYPGNAEVCDPEGHDEDCDPASFGFRDLDMDGEADAACCNIAGDGTRFCGSDCDDGSINVRPGQTEACDGRDDDCDGEVDEGATERYWRDADGDRFGAQGSEPMQACSAPEGYVDNDADCDDTEQAVNGGQAEICDGLDNNCNGETDEGLLETLWPDVDRDGLGDENAAPELRCPGIGYSDRPTDCDDDNPITRPGAAEACDLEDNDCDGEIDENGQLQLWYPDTDGDLQGDVLGSPIPSCPPIDGRVLNRDDCDDDDANTYSGAPQICDRVQNNCALPGGGTERPSEDVDDDGFASVEDDCRAGPRPQNDCDDADPLSFPGAPELCDGIDNDCDGGGGVDVSEDADEDGHAPLGAACEGGDLPIDDCDDADPLTYLGAPELCDDVDQNCSSGGGPTLDEDFDRDGLAAVDATCSGGTLPRADCDDARADRAICAPTIELVTGTFSSLLLAPFSPGESMERGFISRVNAYFDDGAGGFTTSGARIEDDYVFADVDGNGPRLYTLEGAGSSPYRVQTFDAAGEREDFGGPNCSIDDRNVRMAAGDLNGDGRDEILAIAWAPFEDLDEAAVCTQRGTGAQTAVQFDFPQIDNATRRGYAILEVTGDTLEDIVRCQPSGLLEVLANQTTGETGFAFDAPATLISDARIANCVDVARGEVTGDGVDDLVGLTEDGFVFILSGDTLTLTFLRGSATTLDASTRVALADVDEDGRLDILVPSFEGVLLHRHAPEDPDAGALGFVTYEVPLFAPRSPSHGVNAAALDTTSGLEIVTATTQTAIRVARIRGGAFGENGGEPCACWEPVDSEGLPGCIDFRVGTTDYWTCPYALDGAEAEAECARVGASLFVSDDPSDAIAAQFAFSNGTTCEAVAPIAAPASPPDECVYFVLNGTGYFRCDVRRSFADARAACQAVGGDLARIDDFEEDIALRRRWNGWIGGELDESTNTWRWVDDGTAFYVDGAPVDGVYSGWRSSRPSGDSALTIERGGWTDERPQRTEPYYCELP